MSYQINDTLPPVKKKRKRNYINNPDFHAALVKYFGECKTAETNGKRLPQIPMYICECIMTMTKRILTKPRFANYPFKEDMEMDAIEMCFKYLDRYNPEKYENPFAYFTTFIHNAFFQRINKERRYLYIKYKNSQHMMSSGGYDISTDHMNAFIENYEAEMETKKQKASSKKEEKKLLENNENSDNN